MIISVGPYLSGWCLWYLEMHAELNAFYGSHGEREKVVCFARLKIPFYYTSIFQKFIKIWKQEMGLKSFVSVLSSALKIGMTFAIF